MSIIPSEIISVNVGKPIVIPIQEKEFISGIYKYPVQESIFLSATNFAGDGQADLEKHGGADKAVCVYCYEHYPYWENQLKRTLPHGAFGENLTVTGMLELTICIGDTIQLGDAVVQVSQPRQPCHKLAKKYDVADLPVQVQNTGFTGYYFRVLQEGTVSPKSPLRVLSRHPQQIPIAYANQIMHHERDNMVGIKRLLAIPELAASWRTKLASRLAELESSLQPKGKR